MIKQTTFGFQLFIIGGFLVFFYMFFAFATSVYRNYKLEVQIESFESEIESLAEEARNKPDYIAYVNSAAWKDLYAKESLNLFNPGERVIRLPNNDQVVEGEVQLMTEELSPDSILNQPNPVQWRAYFFGQTLSVQSPVDQPKAPPVEELLESG